MNTTQLRFCKDCYWVRVPWLDRIMFLFHPYKFAECTNPKFSLERSFVDGSSSGISSCRNNRLDPYLCGPSGKEWRPRVFEDTNVTFAGDPGS